MQVIHIHRAVAVDIAPVIGLAGDGDGNVGLGRPDHRLAVRAALVHDGHVGQLKVAVVRCGEGIAVGEIFHLDAVDGAADRQNAALAVGVIDGQLHAGGVEGLALVVAHFIRQLRHLHLIDGAGQRHQIGGVVLEEHRALAVGNGRADGVLRLIVGGGEQGVGRFHRAGAAALLIGLGGGFAGSRSRILQQPQCAGGEVVKEVDAGVFIGGGQQSGGLGIALGGHTVEHAHGIQIHHGDVVAGIRAELGRAGHANIGPALIQHRRTGAHGRCFLAAAAVAEGAGARIRDLPAVRRLRHGGGVEIPSLGGEVEASVPVSGDGAAHVAPQAVPAIQLLAGGGIKAQQRAGGAGGSILSVVGAHQQIVVADIRARPVEAAHTGIRPAGQLFFTAAGGILVGGGQADEIGVLLLLIPESGIHIAVMVGQGTVGLAAQHVLIDPQGLQRGGIKGLHRAAAEGHEQHAAVGAVGGGGDGEAGGIAHGAGGHHRTGDGFHLVQRPAAVDDQELHAALLDKNGAAQRGGAVAVAQLIGPAEHGGIAGGGGLGVHHAVGVVIAPEGGPAGGDACAVAGDGSRGQRNDDLLRLAGGDLLRVAHIAGAGGHAGVGQALHQRERAVVIGPDAGTAAHFVHGGQRAVNGLFGVLILNSDGGVNRRALFQRQGIGAGLMPLRGAGGQGKGLLLFRLVQRQRDGNGLRRFPGLRIHLRRVDLAAVYLHTVARDEGCHRQHRLLGGAEDGGLIVILLPVEAVVVGDLALDHRIVRRLHAVHRQRHVRQCQHSGEIHQIVLLKGDLLLAVLPGDEEGEAEGFRPRLCQTGRECAGGYPAGHVRILAIGTRHADLAALVLNGDSPDVYAVVPVVHLRSIDVGAGTELFRGQIHAGGADGAGRQLQAGQVVVRLRRDRRDGQGRVALLGSGENPLGVVVLVLCGDVGIAAVAGGQGIGAVGVHADLRTGGVEDAHRHVIIVLYRQGDGGLSGDGEGIGGGSSALRHGDGDGGCGVAVFHQRKGIRAVPVKLTAVHRDGIAAVPGRPQHHRFRGDHAGVFRGGAGEVQLLVNAARHHAETVEGRGALQRQLPRLIHGIAVHIGAGLQTQVGTLCTGGQHIRQRLMGGFPAAALVDLLAVDVGIHGAEGNLAAVPLVGLALQISAGHTVQVQPAGGAHRVGHQRHRSVLFHWVAVFRRVAAVDRPQHRLSHPRHALRNAQGRQRLVRHGHAAVLRHRHDTGRAVQAGGQGEGIAARRQRGVFVGKGLFVAVGIRRREGVVRQQLAGKTQKPHVQRLGLRVFVLRIGLHPLRQRRGQRRQLVGGLFHHQRLGGGVILLPGELLHLGLFRLLPRQHGAAQRAQRRGGLLVQRVIGGQEQERAHAVGALLQIKAALVVAAGIVGRHAVDGGDEAVDRFQPVEGVGRFLTVLQRQQRLAHRLVRLIGNALRRDEHLHIGGGKQQEAVVVRQRRIGTLRRRLDFRRGGFLRGGRLLRRLFRQGLLCDRRGRLDGPRGGGQQAQGHDQRHEKRYDPFFHSAFPP